MQLNPFLMFAGQAEAALKFYLSQFPGSRIVSMQRYGAGETGAAGSVRRAEFEIAGLRLIAIDSPIKHGFSFTPAFSLFVTCDDIAQLDRLVVSLSEGGQVLMPPDNYGFSPRFAWVQDRFGVAWQLNCV